MTTKRRHARSSAVALGVTAGCLLGLGTAVADAFPSPACRAGTGILAEAVKVAFPAPAGGPCSEPVRLLRTRAIDVLLAKEGEGQDATVSAILLTHSSKGPVLASRNALGKAAELGDLGAATAVTLGAENGIVFLVRRTVAGGYVEVLRPFVFGKDGAKPLPEMLASATGKAADGTPFKTSSTWALDVAKWIVFRVDYVTEEKGKRTPDAVAWRVTDSGMTRISGRVPEAALSLAPSTAH